MRILHTVAVFVCFFAYPMDAEVCPQGIKSYTTVQCRNCTGDLEVAFTKTQPVPYYSSDGAQDLLCTVNKPANVSIFFEPKLKPYNEKPLELTKDGKVQGITVAKSNGGCTYTVQFNENTKSLCQYGFFTCKATTDANETSSKTVDVYLLFERISPPMTFTVEDNNVLNANELILGTSTNLSCSYTSREWNTAIFSSQPFIKFFRLDNDGGESEIKDSDETPKKYENQGRIDIVKHIGILATGTRRLLLRNIDADVGATYLCRVQTHPSHGCHLEKKLKLITRHCKTGYYCNQNSSKELPCKEGTYSNMNGSFSESNCRICPINSYCPSGSALPSPCPKSGFLPARLAKVKMYEGKGRRSECRSCPVDPCDKEGSKCSFICSKKQHKGVLEQPISIRCSLSNGTLMRNLTWLKGTEKIVTSCSHTVSHDEKNFVLKIHRLSLDDVGDYTCSGNDVIMGNHFYSTTNLVATGTVQEVKKSCSKCSNICSEKQHKGVLGQPISIRCSLSNRTLLQNLAWLKGGKKVIGNCSYNVRLDGHNFVLRIKKLSQDDVGKYTCSGTEKMMGRYFYSTTNLVATEPVKEAKKNSILYWKGAMFALIASLFIVTTGRLVRKYLRQRSHGQSKWRMREHGIELAAPIVSETFLKDSKTVYGGNKSTYDVFICYSSNDKRWVRGTLLPKLRNFELRVCIDFEDFSPGRYTIENVAEAIYSSRKTIAVLSPDFLSSAWCHKELMMALSRVNDKHKVIPVMYRHCKVPLFLCEVTYLDWCNKDVKQTFWEQLLRTINNGKPSKMKVVARCLEEDAAESKVDV